MKILYDHKRKKERETKVKYNKELHEQLRRDLQEDSDDDAVFTYAAFECLLDEIDRLNAERRWVPVSERLPESYTKVLAYCDDGYTYTLQAVKNANGEIEFGFDDVTHWMPLPEPPEEK